ncbi:MAG: endonuclease/exonuclease/phosphatase family protein [Bacteroidota bacterium]
MRKTIITTLFISITTLILAQNSISILTWNIKDLGRTKDESEIKAISKIMNEHDLIAIQEIVAKDPAGAQKVAEIADLLNRMGNKWDYRISNPTNSPSSYIKERYAYIWKTAKLTQIGGRPYLDESLATICDREPYIAKFKTKSNEEFYTVNFHSRPYNKHPDLEIAAFSSYTQKLNSESVVILGDFNMDEEHKVWKGLYQQGFKASIYNSPTTLKRKCTATGAYLNHSIDNIYYNSNIFEINNAGRIDFVGDCSNLERARSISDHLPVYAELSFEE